jgi:hypothetical protein
MEAMDESLFESVGQEAACDRERGVAAGKEMDEPAAGFEDAVGLIYEPAGVGQVFEHVLGGDDGCFSVREGEMRRDVGHTPFVSLDVAAQVFVGHVNCDDAYGHSRPPPASTMMEPAGRSRIFSPTVRS